MEKRNTKHLKRPRILIAAVIAFTLILAGAAAGFVAGVLKELPDPAALDLKPDILTTFIYDKDGKKVADLHGAQHRIPVDLERVPEELIQAFIATEDRAFYSHPGINPMAFVRAAIANFRAGKIVQGGSTITMQLADNVFLTDVARHSYREKLKEAILAIQVERLYTKDEILEAYLNQIYFGHGAYGVQAAAQTYFGKDVWDLKLSECAAIAGITNNPAVFSPFNNIEAAKRRRAVVLDNMVEAGFISRQKAEEAKEQPFELVPQKIKGSTKYPYFIDAVVSEAEKLLKQKGLQPADIYRSGLHVYTTMDTAIQEKMQEVYSNPDNFPRSGDGTPVQSAMVVLDPHTGGIRGIVGGREHEVKRGFNRAVQARRQPGSAIKPLAVYGPALELGYPPATVIDDLPVAYRLTGGEVYTPENYDGRYRGLVTMREALRLSINIPAVKMLNKIGVEAGYRFAKNLGLPLTPGDRGLSLALGGLTKGVTPLEMAAAYGAFANQGVWVAPHTITKITDHEGRVLVESKPERRAVMSEQTAYLMTDMLQTVVDSGTGTNARISGRPVAGKTGTTQLPDLPEFRGIKGNKDAWFIGYTPRLVGAVWIGYDETTPQHYLRGIYGGSACAPIWKKVMEYAVRNEPVSNFPRPDGIVRITVDAKSGKLPSELTPEKYLITEIFARDMVPAEVSDVWVELEICSESGKLATDFCPDTATEVFLKRPVPYDGPVKPEDAVLEAPQEKCPIHRSGNVVAVKICTDPRHGGEPHLANMPIEGYKGGCPPEYVVQKIFPLRKIPQKYCDIPEHQLRPEKKMESPGDKPPAPSLRGEISIAGNGGKKKVDLSWEIPPYSGVLLYSIERWTENNPAKHEIALTTKTSWTDNYVKSGTTYYYRVIAADAFSNIKTPSNTVKIYVEGN